MRDEKGLLVEEVLGWLRESPFLILIDYRGMTVPGFSELRRRLREVDAQCHVVKNTMLRLAGQRLERPALDAALHGQTAMVTGHRDICTAAKVLKGFAAEFDKGKVKVGVIDSGVLTPAEVRTLADLPSLDVLRAQLLGLLVTPATRLVRTLNEPGSRLARVLQAKIDAGGVAVEA